MADSFPSIEGENYFESIGSVDSAPAYSNAQSVSPSFAYNQPAYMSVNLGNVHPNSEHPRLTGTTSDFTLSSRVADANGSSGHKTGLMKWKGAVMGGEAAEDQEDDEQATGAYQQSSHKPKVSFEFSSYLCELYT